MNFLTRGSHNPMLFVVNQVADDVSHCCVIFDKLHLLAGDSSSEPFRQFFEGHIDVITRLDIFDLPGFLKFFV